MDRISPKHRSWLMGRIGQKHTKPEIEVRKIVFSMGYRYRLHRADLPGKPDLAFPSRRKVIFVHGCFWHGHSPCKLARIPKTNSEFWKTKISSNRRRDERDIARLGANGWGVFIVWQCELRNPSNIAEKIRLFLDSVGHHDVESLLPFREEG